MYPGSCNSSFAGALLELDPLLAPFASAPLLAAAPVAGAAVAV
jgi:hypothetical protein